MFAPGGELVVSPADEITVGLTTCYDLRFPELFRILALRGAAIITLPSAFTAATGVPHWEPLVRARAIENQVFVIAPDQCGTSPDGIRAPRPLLDRRPVGKGARGGRLG